MSIGFNVFQAPLAGSSATQLRYSYASQTYNNHVYQVRINGNGLSIDTVNKKMNGTVTNIELFDVTANKSLQTVQLPGNTATAITAFAQKSLAVMDDTLNAWSLKPLGFDHVGSPKFNATGTSVTAALKTATGTVIGYLKITGTGLTDANFDNGLITKVEHLNLSGGAVVGHTKTYAVPVLGAYFDYGLLKVTHGTDGNPEVIYWALTTGNDILTQKSDGGSALEGGAGDDRYDLGTFYAYINDVSGKDTVTSTISRDLSDKLHVGEKGITQIENLKLLGVSAINGTGNALGNTITGNDAANVLDGKGGNDTLIGGKGNDTLIGGAGRDMLTGGLNNDTFKFNAVADMGKTAATRDVITDFIKGADKIDVSAIDANAKTAAVNDAFTFLATKGAAFIGVAGQLHYTQVDAVGTANDKTIVEGDVNGDKIADFQIELTGLINLAKTDFVL